jgi:exo beta-1,2-glucooligosaccharide sophorohydrolase (non-reducing end)
MLEITPGELGMKKTILVFAPLVLLFTLQAFAQYDYDSHVLFDNSLADGSFYYGRGSLIAPSKLELTDGKIPVDAGHWFSPPNALKLQWQSATGGDWDVNVSIQGRLKYSGDALVMWVYSDEDVDAESSPRIGIRDRNGVGADYIPMFSRIGKLKAKQWTRLSLPFSAFHGQVNNTSDEKFDPSALSGIRIVQGLDDDKPHTIYIDEIQVANDQAPVTSKPVPPPTIAAKGYDRHIDVSWQLPPKNSARYFKIYRSVDGGEYTPIASQRGDRIRYEDFLGASGKTASYKVSAVGEDYSESPMSAEAKGTTHEMSDDELLTMVQEGCFRYYWEAAHPVAGMAIELTPGDKNLVALGSSGFGVMAIVTGADRGFVTREQAADRLVKIVRFLSKADRFHGVWPHFLNGNTGKVTAYFGPYDDGGDLIESAFLMQGLLVARQYFDRDTPQEREIRDTVTKFWREMEFDWYRKGPDPNFLYWHWSPDKGFYIHHPLIGWNETMIAYLLGIASPTHPIPPSMYYTGWASQSETAVRYRQGWGRTTQGDHYANGNTYYGHKLDVGVGNGAELFFTQFSFFAFDPRNKHDKYTNYFNNNRNIALIAHDYAVENPRHFKGYGDNAWGRSAGVNVAGGRSLPRDDNGTLNIMASLGAFPYTPEESMKALKHFYRDLGGKLWGEYGFRDGYNETENWYENTYMALNQAPIVIMIENHRTGLIWKNFTKNPEIVPALKAIGFVDEK